MGSDFVRPPLATVRSDREKVQQILLNLLNNASKFTGTGGRVTLECHAAGREVFVRVADTGIDLTVVSTPGLGSAFTLALPRAG